MAQNAILPGMPRTAQLKETHTIMSTTFGKVEFNDELVEALLNDKLVIFAGAGVSVEKPSSLPSFKDLLSRIETYFQVTKNCNETADQFLGRLETQEYKIRAYIVNQLAGSTPNPLHSNLLDIRARGAEPKLVTTNFDRLFEATVKGRELRSSGRVYSAPALPPGGRFAGIVNIHGTIDLPDDMVLTDSNIGRAYLKEGWALEFLQGLFRTQHVLFVGYSHQDPIVHYLARAMPTDNNPARRFILTHQHSALDRNWNSLGIEPILYRLGKDDNHDEAAEAIAELAEYQRRAPSTWRQLIAQRVSQPSPPVDASSLNIADRALQDPELTPTFTANAENLNWIQWCLDRGHLKGVFDYQDTEVSDLLLSWVARLLTNHDPYDAIVIIEQGGRKLHPQLWWKIAHQLPTSPNFGLATSMARWIPYLLAASPPDQDRRKPDGLYQLARICIAHGLYMVAVSIFEDLCRPVITAQPGRPSREHIKLRTVGEPWALSGTWASMREHLDVVAPKVIELAARQMELRHSILEQWGQTDRDKDEDSSGRHLVEESQFNHRGADIDILLDAARECLEWAVHNDQELLELWVERLVKSPAPLVRRLAVHTIRLRTDLDAGAKIDWLFVNSVPLDSRISRETVQLLESEYKNLDDERKRRIIAAMNDTGNLGEGL